jgi:outer membrane protein assembly factor BamB
VKKKMKNKKQGATKIAIAILAILLASTLVMLSNNAGSSTVSALYSSISQDVDPVTGEPYGDIMQYEWPMTFHDPGNTRFSHGPAPGKPDILWEFSAPRLSGEVTVFNGKAFIGSYALNAFTGEIEWTSTTSVGGATKIDDEYFIIEFSGTPSGLECYKIETGELVWTIDYEGGKRTPAGSRSGNGIYSPELKMMFTLTYNATTMEGWIRAYDLSDPSQPPPIAWTTIMDEPFEISAVGDGKVFMGSATFAAFALDAEKGTLLWRTPRVGFAGDYFGAYYNGKYFRSSYSTRLTCYDGETGAILWEYDAGGRNYFSHVGSAAYGNYYVHNIRPYPSGYVAAWDVETGEIEWQKEAWYYIGYLDPVLADGKLYITSSDGAEVAGRPAPEGAFTCYDAFSGEILWDIPQQFSSPSVAYGNLYGIAGGTLYCFGPARDWSMWRGNTDQPGVGQSGPANLSVRWKYRTDAAVTSSPAVVDGKVYIGSHDENIYCLNAGTGSLVWKFPIDFRVMSSPAVVDGRVYTGADDGYIHCINAETGTEIWETYAGGRLPILFPPIWQPRSSPIVVGNRLFVGALDGNVYCLDTAANGNILWNYTTGGPIGGSPAYADGIVYIESTDRYIYGLNATTGTRIWRIETPLSAFPYHEHLQLVGSPIVAEGIVFIGGGRDNEQDRAPLLLGLDAKNGTIVWDTHLEPRVYPVATPTYVNGILYISEGFYASAFNATDGTNIWRQWLGYEGFSSMAYADDPRGAKVYIGSDVYSITCLNASDGEVLSVYTTGANVHSSPTIYEGKIYVGSADGYVYCFDDSPSVTISILAEPDKGAQMWSNETMTICGQLRAVQTNNDTGAVFYPGIMDEKVLVTLIDPDLNQIDLTATTDMDGNFEVSYSPTKKGSWSWMAWYEGKDFMSHSYSEAYGEAHFVEVVSPPTEEPSNGNGEEPPPEEGIPMEYVYAIVAVIAIAIIAVAAYIYMKRKK